MMLAFCAWDYFEVFDWLPGGPSTFFTSSGLSLTSSIARSNGFADNISHWASRASARTLDFTSSSYCAIGLGLLCFGALLSEVWENLSGEETRTLLWLRLIGPLGISSIAFSGFLRQGVSSSFYGLLIAEYASGLMSRESDIAISSLSAKQSGETGTSIFVFSMIDEDEFWDFTCAVSAACSIKWSGILLSDWLASNCESDLDNWSLILSGIDSRTSISFSIFLLGFYFSKIIAWEWPGGDQSNSFKPSSSSGIRSYSLRFFADLVGVAPPIAAKVDDARLSNYALPALEFRDEVELAWSRFGLKSRQPRIFEYNLFKLYSFPQCVRCHGR